MKKVRIMRGLPGSGKSCFGNEVGDIWTPLIVSADNFFLDKNGTYCFNPKKLAAAHKSCRLSFLNALNNLNGPSLIIVDNTNTTLVELAFYCGLATLFTDDVEILTLCPPPIMAEKEWLNQCFKKNQHGVPLQNIKAMNDRLKKNKVPHYWREKLVTREDGYFLLNGKRYEI